MALTKAPHPTYRLIPSRFPPIDLFELAATREDAMVAMELAGWTNDRLVTERLRRLPESEWVHGRPNASIVLAAFLHAPPAGARFSGPDLGAWYAAERVETSIAEVAHHLRREAFARGLVSQTRQYRVYEARLVGDYEDIRAADDAGLYSSESYGESQRFGENVRARGGDGIVYDSLRHRGGVAFCAYRPSKIVDVIQAEHFAVTVRTDMARIIVQTLPA